MISNSPGKVSPAELLQTKSPQAFEELYDRYAGALYGVIGNKVHDTKTAAQLLTDVFLKAWKTSSNFDTSGVSLFTWLLRITHKTCNDHLKKGL